MRFITGTGKVAAVGTEVNLYAVPLKIKAAVFKARDDNAGVVYLGGDSGVNSTAGYAFPPGHRLPVSFGPGAENSTTFWIDASDTTSLLDFVLITDV
jgi:hypothetical protein